MRYSASHFVKASAFGLSLTLLPLAGVATAQMSDSAQTSTETGRAADTVTDNDSDWGWVGLLGLMGLVGLSRRGDARVTHGHDVRTAART